MGVGKTILKVFFYIIFQGYIFSKIIFPIPPPFQGLNLRKYLLFQGKINVFYVEGLKRLGKYLPVQVNFLFFSQSIKNHNSSFNPTRLVLTMLSFA